MEADFGGGKRMKMQYHVDEIELYAEPRKKILPQITSIPKEPEMSEFESAFLCGILKKFRPQKILEVGIASGGSTAIILQCLDMLQLNNVEMHSVDFSERFYRNMEYQSGFLGAEAKEIIKNPNIKHQFHLGNIACSFMEEIGGEIDCLILDTMHSLPGEVWDFITLLPFLKDGAVVVLHDICFNQFRERHRMSFATGTLFSTVVAEKFWNKDFQRNNQYPNIGAFVVHEETREQIVNVFLSLMLTWGYYPEQEQYALYRSFVKKYYPQLLLDLFDMSYQLNGNYEKRKHIFPYDKVDRGNNIVLYGAGEVGNTFFDTIQKKKYCHIVKWVDRRYEQFQNKSEFKIDSVESICDVEFDAIVIAVLDDVVAEKIKQDLMHMGIAQQKIVWSEYYKI